VLSAADDGGGIYQGWLRPLTLHRQIMNKSTSALLCLASSQRRDRETGTKFIKPEHFVETKKNRRQVRER